MILSVVGVFHQRRSKVSCFTFLRCFSSPVCANNVVERATKKIRRWLIFMFLLMMNLGHKYTPKYLPADNLRRHKSLLRYQIERVRAYCMPQIKVFCQKAQGNYERRTTPFVVFLNIRLLVDV